MNKTFLKVEDYILLLPLIFCTVFLIFPPIATIKYSFIINMACYMVWFILSTIMNKKCFLEASGFYLICFMFIAYVIIMPYLLGNGTIGNRYANLILIPMGPYIFHYYKVSQKMECIKLLIYIFSIFVFITYLRTIIALIGEPYLLRSIKTDGDYSISLKRQGIGGYEFVYCCSLIFCISFTSIFKNKNKNKIIVNILICCLLSILIIMSNYLTALLMISIDILFVIFSFFKKTFLRRFVGICSLLILMFLYSIMEPLFIKFLLSFLDEGGKTYQRLLSFDNGIILGLIEEFISDRLPTLVSSINSFLMHPLFGMITESTLIQNGLITGSIGQHSYILDTFSFYGMIIGIINLCIIFRPFQNKIFGINASTLSWALCLNTFIVLFFNNATQSISFVIMILYPYICEMEILNLKDKK